MQNEWMGAGLAFGGRGGDDSAMHTSWRLFVGAVVLFPLSGACDFGLGASGLGAGKGVAEACSSSGDCREGLSCDSATKTCQPTGSTAAGGSCTLTAECADGLYCATERTCATAGDNAEGSSCDSTGDCEAGLVCMVEGFGSVCRAGGDSDLGVMCTGTLDCFAGLTCSALTSLCAEPDATSGTTTLPGFWSGETCGDEDEHAVAYFRVPGAHDGDDEGDGDKDFYRLPFPNDVRRTSTGLNMSGHPTPGTVLPVDVIGRYVEASEEDLDGFATNPVVLFRFSKPYDWGTISGNVQLVNITAASSQYNQSSGASWLTTAGSLSKYVCEDWLAVRTPHGSPLLPATTYALVLSNGITPEDGGTFARDSDLTALLDGTAPSNSQLQDGWNAYAPLRTWISDQGVDAATILNATVFTTQDPEAPIQGLRDAVHAQAMPTVSNLTLCDGVNTSPCDDGDQRACGSVQSEYHEIHGKISLPIFQQGTAPYLNPEDGGGFVFNTMGVPQVQRTEEVCFALTVPKAGTMPSAGYPVMLHAHGTGGSMRSGINAGLAREMASGTVGSTTVQAVTIGIDLPQHGSRRGDSTEDASVLFYNFANPRAARDNVAQGTADLMSVIRWAGQLSLTAMESPTGSAIDLDGDHMVMFAHSQGATHASLLLPEEDGLQGIVLSGNGGDLTESLLNKTEPVNIAGVLPFALLDVASDGSLVAKNFHPALALFQSYFERVDPVNVARRLNRSPLSTWPGMHVLMTYGPGDSYSPDATMEAYAKAARFDLVRPLKTDNFGLNEVDGPLSLNETIMGTPFTQGIRQYEPDDASVDGHFVSTRSTDGLADVLRFMRQILASIDPTIGS